MNRGKKTVSGALLAAMAFGVAGAPAEEGVGRASQRELSRPDGKAPDLTRKVRVFILMGQSNMVGMGDIDPETKQGTLRYLTRTEKKYPFLVDDAGNWTVRKDVYYYDARLKKGGPLTATSNGRSIGPELGFGFVMGQILDEPVLILKSCIGNRSLGWDLLPPGSERYQADVTERGGKKVTKVFAGYKDAPDSWEADPTKGLATPPPPFIDKKTGKVIEWHAGKQYDDDMANAKAALKNLSAIYPDYRGQGYEIAGFVWWQGHKDQNPVHASRYEQNLGRLIQCLRKNYNAPDAQFVLATIAFGGWKLAEPGLTIANAQLAVGDPKKHPEFAGNVKTVEARDFWRAVDVSPKNQGYHYNRNAGTYMDVGLSLGWAMAELLHDKPSNR